MGSTPEWTYERAGVDRRSVGLALSSLLREVRYRPPPSSGRAVDLPGHYAGLVRVGRELLAMTTDTVGTKALLAEQLGRWEEVGEDLVAVNVNDLAAVGARPAAFVDCISLASPDPAVFQQIGRGIDRGLREAKCALIGGETAVVPELLRGTDLGGTALGFYPRGRQPVTGRSIRPGDTLVGIPSSGLHANGFTLVRRLLAEQRVDLRRPRPDGSRPLGEELLTASRIYVGAAEALAGRPEVHGLAHLSGGGVRNLVRLHARVSFVFDRWPAAAGIFGWLASIGRVREDELFQTFNMGIGFVAIVAPRHLSDLLRRLSRAGAPDALVIGHVERGKGVHLPKQNVEFEGYGG